MSENAKLHFALRNAHQANLAAVLEKTQVLYPGVEDDFNAYQRSKQRKRTPPYRLLFVGNDFFRKGGPYACAAFKELKDHFPIELTVISTLNTNNDFYPISSREVSTWEHDMQNLGITHLKSVSPAFVRELLSQTDLLLLPTLEDSFGFSVVEAMATGVPCVATGVEALLEIVDHDVTGKLLKVPLQEENRIVWNETTANLIQSQLTATLASLLNDPTKMQALGMAARKKYEHMFHPTVVGQQLRLIYDEALSS